MRFIVLLSLSCVFGLPVSAAEHDPGEECQSHAGMAYFPTRDHVGVPDDQVVVQSAIAACKRAVAEIPKSGLYWALLGRSYALSGDVAGAKSALSRSAELKMGAGYLGLLFLQTDSPSEAELVKTLKKASQLGFYPADYDLAVRFFIGGEAHHARELLNEPLNHRYPPAEWLMSVILAMQDGPAATDTIEDLLRSACDAGFLDAVVSMGDFYSRVGDYAVLGERGADYAEAINYYRRAADAGHARSMYILASRLFVGDGVPKNIGEAVHLLERSLQLGNTIAAHELAILYLSGDVVEQDLEKGLEYLRHAANNDVPNAAYLLGKLYFTGEWQALVAKDLKKGIEYLEKAESANHALATSFLATIYLEGIGVQESTARGLELLGKAADLGVTEAQVYLGEIYLTGNYGIEIDYERAWNWIKRGADNGSWLGHYLLGTFYEHGYFVDENTDKAIEHYRIAAHAGESLAFTDLGLLLWDSASEPGDEAEAVDWLLKAAASGDERAVSNLGWVFMHGGREFTADPVKGVDYLRQAHAAGDAWAEFQLALAYLDGIGVEKDVRTAVNLLRSSSDSGIELALYYLGKTLLLSDDSEIRDVKTGLSLLQKSTKMDVGADLAAFELAQAYEYGVGVKVNHKKAISYYVQAGSAIQAAYLLAFGDKSVRDIKRAEDILRACFDNSGDGGCATFIGYIYADISSEKYNPNVAKSWYEKGGENGDVEGLLNLAEMLIFGMGVNADLPLALDTLIKAENLNRKLAGSDSLHAEIDLAFGNYYLWTGDTAKAELHLRRGLLEAQGEDDNAASWDIVVALNNLGSLYIQQGRYGAAIELFSDIRGFEFVDDETREFARYVSSTGIVTAYIELGQLDRASVMLSNDSSLDYLFGDSDNALTIAIAAMVRGALYTGLDQYEEARDAFETALPILVEGLGGANIISITATGALGSTYYKLGQFEKARQFLSNAIEAGRKAGYSGNAAMSFAQAELAKTLKALGHSTDAQDLAIEAIDGMLVHISQSEAAESVASVTGRRRAREVVAAFLEIARETNQKAGISALNREFVAAQIPTSLAVDEAIRNWTTRQSSSDHEVQAVIQELQIARDQQRTIDLLFQRSIMDSPEKRLALSKRLSEANEDISRLTSKLVKMGGKPRELLNSQPIDIADLQKVLKDGEVLLSYLVTKRATYGWSISASTAYRFDVPISDSELRSIVRSFRQEVVPFDGKIGDSEELRRLAHELYRLIIEPGINGQPRPKRLTIIPDSFLVEVPYAALRTSRNPSIGSNAVDASWLVAEYAISVSPSPASLVALRSYPGSVDKRSAFLGIGNPVFSGTNKPSADMPGVYADFFDMRGLGDAEAIRSLRELPETERELETIAELFEQVDVELLLREEATETAVKNLRLNRFSVVAFATHGLVAGSAVGNAEPALVLTPPEVASEWDDGLLTTSEIAALNMDANIVILSACDTAAGGADHDAMGMSGLARAFFLSGTRNVLASNWPVVSEAAATLTTEMFNDLRQREVPDYAVALQTAMLNALELADDDLERHPMYWASFVLIGE